MASSFSRLMVSPICTFEVVSNDAPRARRRLPLSLFSGLRSGLLPSAGRVSRQLPPEFQEAIDTAAMSDGDTAQDAYQAGFTWGPPQERPGSSAEAADAVVAEIIAAYPKERLTILARRGRN